jgi:hypothetical protein
VAFQNQSSKRFTQSSSRKPVRVQTAKVAGHGARPTSSKVNSVYNQKQKKGEGLQDKLEVKKLVGEIRTKNRLN